MKDKAIGVGLIIAIACTIALVSWVSHKVADPSWAGPVVTALVATIGLVVLWMKQAPNTPTIETFASHVLSTELPSTTSGETLKKVETAIAVAASTSPAADVPKDGAA